MVVSMFGNPNSAGRQGGGSSLASGVAARVDGEEITIRALDYALRRQREQMQENLEDQVAKSENKAETRKFLDQLLRSQVSADRILDELVNEKFSIRVSEIAGLDVPPDAVIDILQHEPYFQKDGKFDPVRYKNVVSEPGTYEAELRQRAKQVALNRSFVSSLSIISPEEEKLDTWLKKKIKLETLNIDPNKFADASAKPSAAEIDAFAKDAAQQQKLQSYFDRNIHKYKSDEQVHARHILIKEEGGGLAKANEILADIKAKKITFEEAAKKFSADKSNSDKGGDLDFFTKERMVPEFSAAAFGLKNKNDLAPNPVKTSFGYHIIQLLDRKPGQSKALNDVKTEVAEQVLTEQKKAEKARAFAKSISENGKAPSDTELKKLGLSWAPNTWSPLDSTLGGIGNIDDYRSKLLSLNKASPVLKDTLNQGEHIVVVRLASNQDAKSAEPDMEDNSTGTPSRLAQEKAYQALQFFLKNEREHMEKTKKIVRNDSAIFQLKQALGDNEGMPRNR